MTGAPIVFVVDNDPAVRRVIKRLLAFRHQDLLDAIQQALGRDRTRRAHQAEIATLLERFESLTSGQRRVLPLVVSGRPNKQIAGEIGTSEATVKVHRSQLMKKMGRTHCQSW
jgi:FixJ family two-component response regulator